MTTFHIILQSTPSSYDRERCQRHRTAAHVSPQNPPRTSGPHRTAAYFSPQNFVEPELYLGGELALLCDGTRRRLASIPPHKNKHQEQCLKAKTHTHWKHSFYTLKNTSKNFKKYKKSPCNNLTDNIYLNSLWKRRRSGKLLSYQVISAEHVLTRWGRRDSPGFSRVGKNEKHTAACTKGVLSKRKRRTRWKQGIWTPCTSIAKTVQKI